MPKVKISFSIVASSARELNGCDSSAEVEMRRPEGEGDDDQDSTGPRRYHWLFGICIRSNRGAQGWRQAAEAGKAAGTNGLQARRYGQRDQLWAGECATAPELRGTTPTAEPAPAREADPLPD